VPITCIERVIVTVVDLEDTCERWSKAGFAIASKRMRGLQFDVAQLHAGAIGIDLYEVKDHHRQLGMWKSALERGGGIVGWIWGIDSAASDANSRVSIAYSDNEFLRFGDLDNFLPGVITAGVPTHTDLATRRANLDSTCGENENTVDYLEHIVVMTPSLEDAIAAHEKIGLPCKRIREAGGGVRQAFFKLEQTVLEIVGPGRGTPQAWGLAFMCKDISRAVDLARSNGLEATEPKTAIQGGKIARIVNPLDGVAIAYMEPSPSS
jgi:predicted enzyme related to lactoylglutathione lyase